MREIFTEALNQAIKAQDKLRMGTLRLITAAIKDRDIAQRGAGKDPLTDDEIRQVLTKMVKQRQESAKIYEDNGRAELAAQEREEIAIIEEFLPAQLDPNAVEAACRQVVADTNAQGLRDVGRCMSALKERYAGQMDFARASGVVKELLR
ncbi:GatB/YqeY domain-containing protein [Antarcticirhabdus aurantiaca]|uniref:GatB/YqeY domain-containing protein n=1 Tax=Antarcticirhabdus aurantiaca TaxID=2606717 RepID=A0ACD4NHI3_9HYPH|nr:GatB/YqeY domain-containing protein [Antarcticirhabdus aurantiaca]WAJ26228.1 GatB/YqeY domain-containing protein [Jeongeuplla avenae]